VLASLQSLWHHVSLSGGLLPVAANSTHGACIVDGCSSDDDPGIRLQSAGLLQLGTQRHHREPFQRLQSVQNAAVRLITQTGRRDHITPVLRQLHWLPVRRRVEFKLAVLVYKALHGLAPPYLSNDCLLVAEVGRRLRSADARTCVVPRTRTQFGDRSFAVVGPRVWNSLPAPLRDTNSIYSFRKQLKTCLFSGGCRA